MTRVAAANAWLDEYRERVPERVLEMARLHVEECLSYAQIGERYGISRQRVGQLLTPLDLAHPEVQRRDEEGLRKAARRIEQRRSTLAVEAEKLGYSSGDSLRTALWRIGLKVHEPPPAMPKHGTVARYRRGCQCTRCRRANADYARERYQEARSTAEAREQARVKARAKRAEKRRRKEMME